MRIEDRGTTRPDQYPDPDPENVSNSLLGNTRCNFPFPCFSSQRSSAVGVAWWQRIRHEDRWWTRAFLKVREWSEIVAGPRWKTFIRRFNRSNHRHGHGGGGYCGGTVGGGADRDRHGQFQYDALSYALNFDEGPVVEAGDEADEDRLYGGFRSFSTRYAAVPPGNKKEIGSGGGGGVNGGDRKLEVRSLA